MVRHNNFDALRVFAALCVLLSHAFLIAEGNDAHEPMILLTGRQCVLGHIGVFIFFTLSGFLVTQSYEQTNGALRYLAKRALRILPGLFGALIVTAFVLAPLVTSLSLVEYFGRSEPYRYVLNNLVFNYRTIHELPGVLFVNNPVGLEVNGAMWTLGAEVLMYLMVLALGSLRLLRLPPLLALLVLGLAFIHFPELDPEHNWALLLDRLPSSTAQLLKASPWFNDWLTNIGGWSWLLAFFAAGMVLYRLRGTRIFDWRVALFAVAGLVASVPLRQVILLFPLFGSYLVIYLALNSRLPVIPAAAFGDLSYGLYIYGWPAEEAMVWAGGGHITWWQDFLGALILAGGMALLSWHVIEKPALRLKPGSPRPERLGSAGDGLHAGSPVNEAARRMIGDTTR